MNLQQQLLAKFFSRFKGSSFDLKFETGEELHIGELPPKFKVIFHQPLHYKGLLQSTSLTLGEAYMDGTLEVEGDLFEALSEILKYKQQFSTDFKALKKLLYTSTSKSNQKQEVCSHYNIGNDFYKLWLDPTMSYSCAYFKHETDSLHQAQLNKIHHILSKLNLEEGMRLLDIGCGWGYLLIEAAKKYKIHGIGITLSEEQYKGFNERIKQENLADYLEVRLMDYRDLQKSQLSFDRVVSVGMLEHVGRDNYELFFKNINSVLKDQGLFLLHYISSLTESPGDPWIKKYIFPGGVIPSLREILATSSDYRFYVQDVESLRRHYVKTLLCWLHQFEEQLPIIQKQFDDHFIKMWTIYLCSCAASFETGLVDLHQILYTKGVNNTLPLTRAYMYQSK